MLQEEKENSGQEVAPPDELSSFISHSVMLHRGKDDCIVESPNGTLPWLSVTQMFNYN